MSMKKITIAIILLAVGANSSFGVENSKCDWLDDPKNLEGYTLISGSDEFKLTGDNFLEDKLDFSGNSSKKNLVAFDFSIIFTRQENQQKMSEYLIENKETQLKIPFEKPYKGSVLIYKDNVLLEKICFENNQKNKSFFRELHNNSIDRTIRYSHPLVSLVQNIPTDDRLVYLLDDLIVFTSLYTQDEITQLKFVPNIYIDTNIQSHWLIGYYFDAKMISLTNSLRALSYRKWSEFYQGKSFDPDLLKRIKF